MYENARANHQSQQPGQLSQQAISGQGAAVTQPPRDSTAAEMIINSMDQQLQSLVQNTLRMKELRRRTMGERLEKEGNEAQAPVQPGLIACLQDRLRSYEYVINAQRDIIADLESVI